MQVRILSGAQETLGNISFQGLFNIRIIPFQTRLDTTGENALVQLPVSLLFHDLGHFIQMVRPERRIHIQGYAGVRMTQGVLDRFQSAPAAMDSDAKVWRRLCIVSSGISSPLPATAFTQMRLYQFFMLMCSPRLGRKTKASDGCPEQSPLRGKRGNGESQPACVPTFSEILGPVCFVVFGPGS